MAETPQNNRAEEAILMEAHRDALGHFQLKLGMLNPDMPIEEQLQSLSKYHDIPDIASIKNGETQLSDGYINDFFLSQVKDFFKSYPKAYDLLGQKSDNILADYAALGIKYHLLGSGEKDKSFREKAIRAYYEYLPKYEQYLLDYIRENGNYQLTKSNPQSLDAYIDLNKQHEEILSGFEGPLSSGKLINAVMVKLFPKIKELKETGISEYYYNRAISDMIIGKFKAYGFLLVQMAKGGAMVLQTVIEPASQPLGINGIYDKLLEVEGAFDLDAEQKKDISELKAGIEALRKNHVGQNGGSGCFGTLLLFATAATGLVASLVIIL